MLIPISPPACDVIIDLKYATADNFIGVAVYHRPVALLRREAAAALTRAAALAAGIGCRLKIYDAFRPVEAQWRLWERLPDPDYVADPRTGSCHSRGVAVDLTLCDAASGAALDMGTGFDDMRPQSHHGRGDIPAAAQRHRALLLGIMTAAGWRHLATEWWHYQLPDADAWPLLHDSAIGGALMDL